MVLHWCLVGSKSRQGSLAGLQVSATLPSGTEIRLPATMVAPTGMEGETRVLQSDEPIHLIVRDSAGIVLTGCYALPSTKLPIGIRPQTPPRPGAPASTPLKPRTPTIFDFGDTLLWAHDEDPWKSAWSSRLPSSLETWRFDANNPLGTYARWSGAENVLRIDSMALDGFMMRFRASQQMRNGCLTYFAAAGAFDSYSIGPGEVKPGLENGHWTSVDTRLSVSDFMVAAGWFYSSGVYPPIYPENRSVSGYGSPSPPPKLASPLHRTLGMTCADSSGWHVVELPPPDAHGLRFEVYGVSPSGIASFALDLPRKIETQRDPRSSVGSGSLEPKTSEPRPSSPSEPAAVEPAKP
ncbi:MAG: hypothetical protein H6686_11495 [Fibrobacteria bacterium]|nr:hypothetical protein [Fibrobacteria bacterium]